MSEKTIEIGVEISMEKTLALQAKVVNSYTF
jgi:hypothetical protein